MRFGKLISLTILLLVCFCQTSQASATTLTIEKMKEIFLDLNCRDTPWPQEQVQIHNFTAQPETLALPAGTLKYKPASAQPPKYLGRKMLNVSILVNGKEYGTIKMTGDLHLYSEVMCASRLISRHEKLTKENTRMVRHDVTMLGNDLIHRQAQAFGKQAKTPLQPGDVIRSSQLDEPLLVKRGDMVTIIAQTGGIRATAPGEAKKNGAQGDTIRVKNLMSRKYIFAEVIANGIVKVAF